MELCAYCTKPIRKADLVWRTQQTARQTHSSPAEYDMVPLHEACAEGDERAEDPHERAAARYDGDGKDWR